MHLLGIECRSEQGSEGAWKVKIWNKWSFNDEAYTLRWETKAIAEEIIEV